MKRKVGPLTGKEEDLKRFLLGFKKSARPDVLGFILHMLSCSAGLRYKDARDLVGIIHRTDMYARGRRALELKG